MGSVGLPSVADAITLLRSAIGLWAIVLLTAGDPLVGVPLILVCMMLDGLDGPAARRFGTSHNLGRALDGGADMICFCAAPAAFVLAATSGFTLPSGLHDGATLPLMVSLALLLFGTVRLLGFIRDDAEESHFTGLPTAALALLALCLLHPEMHELVPRLWAVLAVGLLAPLELTRVPFLKLETAPALVAGLLMLLVTIDACAELAGAGYFMGFPAVLALLCADVIYLVGGPSFVLRRAVEESGARSGNAGAGKARKGGGGRGRRSGSDGGPRGVRGGGGRTRKADDGPDGKHRR
jgi:CDP-diacylglycerol--serine O-phosphatidyltransferase